MISSPTTTPTDPATRFRPVIRVFVSSTFSDLTHERNALQDRIWPELERYCLLRGFQFQAIDLRWGVSTEAGLDHRTMRICMEELRRSQEVSPQPNFLILLGDRYGWQPLPEEITTAEFAALKAANPGNQTHVRILEDWYRLDDNSRTPLHLLRSRRDSPDGQDYTKDADGNDTPAWTDVQNVLWSLVNRAFQPSTLAGRFAESIPQGSTIPSIVRFQGSATEQEIWHGAFGVADAPRHVVAFSREIDNLAAVAGHPRLRDFVNVDESGQADPVLHDAVRALKAQLRGMLGKNYLQPPQRATLQPALDAAGQSRLDISTNHLDFLCQQVRSRLLPIIQQQIDEYHRVPEIAEGASLSGEVLRDLIREREEHERFAAERAPEGVFVGRQAEKARILAYLKGTGSAPADTNTATTDSREVPVPFLQRAAGDRPFIVHGVSGSGKSALLASAARSAAAESGAILLQRFLGISKRSSDLRSLMIDLCQSLREHFPLADELPTDVRLLEKEFYEQLNSATAERPIYVFLDALDQLDPADAAHSLWWIRSTPLPPHARVVLSCLSDPDDQVAGRPWAVLNQRGLLTPANSVAIEHLDPDEARLLWTRWLDQAGRTLSDRQQAVVDARILAPEATACRQPLYLRILFEEARLWRSYDLPTQLGASVPDLLQSLFDRLGAAAAHGPLVEPALGYLVSARYGLTESELLEILLSDPDYKRQLMAAAQHALPPQARRIPIAIWSRLRYDLAPYLAERGAPGGSVLHFYHRQVGNYVEERFVGTAARRYQWHRRLARYFARQHWWLESRAKQRERMQPPYSARPAHVRKITELPDQLLALAREAKAASLQTETEQAFKWIERLFQKLSFLEAKNEAGLVFDLVGDFSRALGTLPAARPQRRIVRLLDEALRRDIHFIARHARDYPQGLFQCVWNNGWWYDCPEAAAHYVEPEGGWNPKNAPWLQPDDHKLCCLLERWRDVKEQTRPGCYWIRSYRPPPVHLGTAQQAVLRGHASAVYSVMYSPDGQRIASGSEDNTVRVWDGENGAELAVLRGHAGTASSVTYSRDGRRIASGSHDATVRVWDAESGAELAVLRGHNDDVNSVAYSPDGRRIASGSGSYHGKDNTVRVWDAESGAELAVLRGHEHQVCCVTYSLDGRRIASGSMDKTVRVWDANSGAELAVLRGHEGGVTSVAYSPDGRRIASGSYDKTVRVWDAESGAEVAVLRGHKGSVDSITYSPDGRQIASGGCGNITVDRTVRVWDAESGAELTVLRGHEDAVKSLTYSPDGRRIASGSWDKTARVWDAQTHHECLTLVQGSGGHLKTVVARSSEFPVHISPAQASSGILETAVEHDKDWKRIAWFPSRVEHIVTHPAGRIWLGYVGNDLYIITLEGGDKPAMQEDTKTP